MALVVTAVHTFVAEHDDELEFQAGDKITVIEKDEAFGDGWWRVSPSFRTLSRASSRRARALCWAALPRARLQRSSSRQHAALTERYGLFSP